MKTVSYHNCVMNIDLCNYYGVKSMQQSHTRTAEFARKSIIAWYNPLYMLKSIYMHFNFFVG